MGYRILVANALVLVGIGWITVSGSETQATGLLPKQASPHGPDVAALEDRAALRPDAPAVIGLATAYLEREQSGLAAAVLERAPRELRERADVSQLEARVLYHRGHAREALVVARGAQAACDASDDIHSACPPWIQAKSARQVAFLEEIVAAGIEDPQANPQATRLAYERSTRGVQLVAMR